MKNLFHNIKLIFTFFGLSTAPSEDAGLNSTYGYSTTPKGELHALVIFVAFEEDSTQENPIWPYDEIPSFAIGENNALFNKSAKQIGSHQNISKWYSDMSMGEFTFTGSIYPKQIIVPMRTNSWGMPIQSLINRDVVKQLKRDTVFDWSRFDKRENGSEWEKDVSRSQPDGELDYVIFMYRIPGSKGMAAVRSQWNKLKIQDSVLHITDGFTSVNTSSDPRTILSEFIHEFGHSLMIAPHIGNANGVVGEYLQSSYAWGMACPDRRLFHTANAWERWYLGWTDIKYDLNNLSDNGVYEIRDFVTTGDAIRIKVPNADSYLWIENHQKLNDFDRPRYDFDAFGDPNKLPNKGLAIYLENISNDRSKIHSFGRNANGIEVLHPRGKFDFIPELDSVYNISKWWNQKTNDYNNEGANPTSGSSMIQPILFDYDNNGKVGYSDNANLTFGKNEMKTMLMVDGVEVYGPFAEDLTFQEGHLIDVGSNPMIIERLRRPKSQKDRIEQHLNNISITALSTDADGTIKVKIEYNQPIIQSHQVWKGEDIILKNDADFQGLNNQLIISSEGSLTLDQCKSVLREKRLNSGYYAYPTRLIIKDGTMLEIKSGGQLKLKNDSKLIIEEGAQLVFDQIDNFKLESSCTIVLRKGARVIVAGNSKKTEEEVVINSETDLAALIR